VEPVFGVVRPSPLIAHKKTGNNKAVRPGRKKKRGANVVHDIALVICTNAGDKTEEPSRAGRTQWEKWNREEDRWRVKEPRETVYGVPHEDWLHILEQRRAQSLLMQIRGEKRKRGGSPVDTLCMGEVGKHAAE